MVARVKKLLRPQASSHCHSDFDFNMGWMSSLANKAALQLMDKLYGKEKRLL